jgi:hypothetical protein
MPPLPAPRDEVRTSCDLLLVALVGSSVVPAMVTTGEVDGRQWIGARPGWWRDAAGDGGGAPGGRALRA